MARYAVAAFTDGLPGYYLGDSDFGEDYGLMWHREAWKANFFNSEDDAYNAAMLKISQGHCPDRLMIYTDGGEKIASFSAGRTVVNAGLPPFEASRYMKFGDMCDEIIREMGFDPKGD